MTKTLRAAIYARFSTDKQRDASIDDQVDSCRDYAAKQGWQIVEVYSDRAVSGSSMFRPGIEALLRDAKTDRFDIVLSEAMDRLSRNLADIAKFHERMEHARITIWTLAEGEVNQMMIGMKGTMNAIMKANRVGPAKTGKNFFSALVISASRCDRHPPEWPGTRELPPGRQRARRTAQTCRPGRRGDGEMSRRRKTRWSSSSRTAWAVRRPPRPARLRLRATRWAN